MKRKIIYSLIFCTFLLLVISKFSFAANTTQMQNDTNEMSNRVDNTMETVGNKIENGAAMVGNEAIKNTTENTAKAVTNETAINPNNAGNTFLGLTPRAWMWIIVIVIIVIIISLIVRYSQDHDEEHHKD